jgi:hypothetical protein
LNNIVFVGIGIFLILLIFALIKISEGLTMDGVSGLTEFEKSQTSIVQSMTLPPSSIHTQTRTLILPSKTLSPIPSKTITQPSPQPKKKTKTPSPTSISSCPGAPPQRLKVNDNGFVCNQNNIPVRIRTKPSLKGVIIIVLLKNERFKVMEGPVCADNYTWWHLDTSSYDGWAAEGETDPTADYFLCPSN